MCSNRRLLTAPPHRVRFVATAAILLLWAGVTAAAFGHFWRVDATPGSAATPPDRVEPSAGRTAVLTFLHPQCPCSRATLAELSRAAACLPRTVDFHVYFIVGDAGDQSWRSSSLYEQAARLPNVSIAADVGGVHAKRYGAKTSGQVIAYRADGTIAFSGGVTGSRGHEGDNAGKSRLLAALDVATVADGSNAPVYGCRLPEYSEVPSSEVLP